jgi:hypothetical protein
LGVGVVVAGYFIVAALPRNGHGGEVQAVVLFAVPIATSAHLLVRFKRRSR